MTNEELMELQAQAAGEFCAYLWLGWTICFFVIQVKRLKKSKELGDTDKVKRIKRQMIWGYPLGLVAILLLSFLFF